MNHYMIVEFKIFLYKFQNINRYPGAGPNKEDYLMTIYNATHYWSKYFPNICIRFKIILNIFIDKYYL
jgi:hypothetical protein